MQALNAHTSGRIFLASSARSASRRGELISEGGAGAMAGARVASGYLRAGQRSWPCGGIMAGALARGRGRGRDIGGWRGRGSGGAIWRGMLSDLYSADYSA